MVVGHVTETQQDVEEQLSWVRNNKKYANNPIHTLQSGIGLGILPGTCLDRNKDELGIKISNSGMSQDWTRESINSTPLIRMAWHQQMQKELTHNGFLVDYIKDNHMLIQSYINDKYNNHQI